MNVTKRLQSYDWEGIRSSLDQFGSAVLPRLFEPGQCLAVSGMYDSGTQFRSHIIMARHGFGRGEYKYFAYPLPDPVQSVREALYPHLAPIANEWNEHLNVDVRYPPTLEPFLKRCHAAGQLRPTPLLLQYGEGDYNCLHQDLYGEHVFPLQLTLLLSQPGTDFEGGEFVMTEVASKGQRAHVISLEQGDGVVFAVNQRLSMGARGARKVRMRHGVSEVRTGHRHTLGVIFHDAR